MWFEAELVKPAGRCRSICFLPFPAWGPVNSQHVRGAGIQVFRYNQTASVLKVYMFYR